MTGLPMAMFDTWHLQRSAATGYEPARRELVARRACIRQAMIDERTDSPLRAIEIDAAIVATTRSDYARERGTE